MIHSKDQASHPFATQTFPDTLREDLLIRGHAAQAIRELRRTLNLTQAAFAEKVGTSQSVIHEVEDLDYAGHTFKMLTRIGAALGYDVSIVFERKKA